MNGCKIIKNNKNVNSIIDELRYPNHFYEGFLINYVFFHFCMATSFLILFHFDTFYDEGNVAWRDYLFNLF